MTDITAQIVTDLRTYYPELADAAVWADATLVRYLQEGDQETGSRRWGSYSVSPAKLKARGMFAYAAHKAALGRAREAALMGGNVPTAPAKVQSKSVGDESVSFAVAAPTASEAAQTGDLNTTIYGQEFLRLRKRAGMGMATTGQVQL